MALRAGLALVLALALGAHVWSCTGEEETSSVPVVKDSGGEASADQASSQSAEASSQSAEASSQSAEHEEGEDIEELIGQTARRFHVPVREGRVDVVAKLLQALQNSPQTLPKIMNWQDQQGATVLHWCAFYGSEAHTLMAKTFLVLQGTDGALLDKHNNTACHTACMRGHTDVLVHLANASNGCDPLEQNAIGLSCLHYAAQRGDTRTLAVLRPDAMDVDAYSGGMERATALYLAVVSGSAASVRELLKAGASASRGRMGADGTEDTAQMRAGRELEAYEDIAQQLGVAMPQKQGEPKVQEL